MMTTLPILSFDDVWSQIGRNNPDIAGQAFVLWSAANLKGKPRTVDSCCFDAIRRHTILNDRGRSRIKVVHVDERTYDVFEDTHADILESLIPVESEALKALQIIREEFGAESNQLRTAGLLARGMKQREIADSIGVNEGTVSRYVEQIRDCFR